MKATIILSLLLFLLLFATSCGGRFGTSGGGGGTTGDPAEAAANAVTLSLPSMASAKPGARCTIPLTLNNGGLVAGLDLTVSVDGTVLSPVGVEGTDMSAGFLVDRTLSSDRIRVVMAGKEAFPQGNGVVANLVFTVNSSAPYGASSPLTLQDMKLYTAEAKKCDGVEAGDGAFTVE